MPSCEGRAVSIDAELQKHLDRRSAAYYEAREQRRERERNRRLARREQQQAREMARKAKEEHSLSEVVQITSMAGLKRALKAGGKVHILTHVRRELEGTVRVPTKVQENGYWFEREGKRFWIAFPPASEVTFQSGIVEFVRLCQFEVLA